jgi:hypothetical protein
MKQTFKQWMHSTYDRAELKEIAECGCICGIHSMTYYSETCALYDLHADELHDLVYNYEQENGIVPAYIVDHLGYLTGFKNAMVWFAAECYAQEMTSEECEA